MAASFRVMIIFTIIPIKVFTIEGMKKFNGKKLSWLLLIKIFCHLITIIGFFETEISLHKSLKIEGIGNFNIGLIILDFMILEIIQVDPEFV